MKYVQPKIFNLVAIIVICIPLEGAGSILRIPGKYIYKKITCV